MHETIYKLALYSNEYSSCMTEFWPKLLVQDQVRSDTLFHLHEGFTECMEVKLELAVKKENHNHKDNVLACYSKLFVS